MTARLLQIAPGEDLLPALSSIEGGAWVQGNGYVEGVELKLPGEATDVTRTLRGRLALVSLQGPTGGPFTVTLARASDLGLDLVGGVLVRARSQGVALLVQPTAAAAPATREPSSRREVIAVAPTAHAPAPAPAAAPAAPLSPVAAASASEPLPARSWADVAAASEEADDDEADSLPERGDMVDHFSFGLCDVVKADGDRLHLRDIKGPGRVREVVVSALKVMPPTRQNGKRCFRLQRKS